jgi:hypothetical protein
MVQITITSSLVTTTTMQNNATTQKMKGKILTNYMFGNSLFPRKKATATQKLAHIASIKSASSDNAPWF